MAIEDIYDRKLKPIYPEATDAYANDIPMEGTLNTPEDLARQPQQLASYVLGAIARSQASLRDMETARKSLAYHASVLKDLFSKSPELMDDLPDDIKSQAQALAGRIQNT